MSWLRDHAVLFVVLWPFVALACAIGWGRLIAHGERDVPYDIEAVERAGEGGATSPAWDAPRSLSDDFQGSWERDSGHGAHW